VRADDAVRADDGVIGDLRAGINNSGRMNLRHDGARKG
jgi:hypothetical protein